MYKKVLVTGAKGMLGQDLCPILEDEGYFLVHNTEKHCIQNSVNILLSLFKKNNYNTVIENLGYNNNKRLTIIHFKKK